MLIENVRLYLARRRWWRELLKTAGNTKRWQR
jgi:hypothetical protein